MNPRATSVVSELLEGEQALQRLRPDLEALTPPFKRRVVSIPHGVAVLLGAQPTIERMLPLMARYTPVANADRIARMRDIGLAAAFVHHRSLPRYPVAPPEYRALIDDAYSLRRRLLSSAAHLADLGLLDERRIVEIRAGRGHIGVGDGLLALATLFEVHWARLQNNTPIERHELHRAIDQGAKLLAVATERRARRRKRPAPDDLFQRTVQLMCEAYEEARRVSAYISWYEPELQPLPALMRWVSRSRAATSDGASVEPSDEAGDAGELRPSLVAAE